MGSNSMDRRSFFKLTAMAGAVAGLAPLATMASPAIITDRKARRLLRVAHITDIHVLPGLVPEYGMAHALNGVNGMADKPDFIIAGGDMIMDAMSTPRDKVKDMWKTFHTIVRVTTLSTYTIP